MTGLLSIGKQSWDRSGGGRRRGAGGGRREAGGGGRAGGGQRAGSGAYSYKIVGGDGAGAGAAGGGGCRGGRRAGGSSGRRETEGVRCRAGCRGVGAVAALGNQDRQEMRHQIEEKNGTGILSGNWHAIKCTTRTNALIPPPANPNRPDNNCLEDLSCNTFVIYGDLPQEGFGCALSPRLMQAVIMISTKILDDAGQMGRT
ncbi:hypothetical protein B0H11DRAFT_1924996 [Mycena galericulata]|nr:hypothetical protein B0H11DRAFT_1924996 [Mycena galericulata]